MPADTNLDACVSIIFLCHNQNTILRNNQWKPRCESPFSTEWNEMEGSACGLLCSFSFFDWLHSGSQRCHGAILNKQEDASLTAHNSVDVCSLQIYHLKVTTINNCPTFTLDFVPSAFIPPWIFTFLTSTVWKNEICDYVVLLICSDMSTHLLLWPEKHLHLLI